MRSWKFQDPRHFSGGKGPPPLRSKTQNTMSASHHNRRPHLLLGITGSIAAVKGPRLALRLANELNADVKVVLTRTVEQYFWKEGRAVSTYDRESWIDFERAVAASSAISIHCKYISTAVNTL